MRGLVDYQYIEKVTFTYDSFEEWNEDNDKMIEQGWKDEENYFDDENNKYIQVYTKEIN